MKQERIDELKSIAQSIVDGVDIFKNEYYGSLLLECLAEIERLQEERIKVSDMQRSVAVHDEVFKEEIANLRNLSRRLLEACEFAVTAWVGSDKYKTFRSEFGEGIITEAREMLGEENKDEFCDD